MAANTLELRSQTTFHGPSTSPIQPAKPTSPWDSREGTLSTAPDKSKQLVRPVLEYAAPVWDAYRQAYIKALEQVQRRAALYVNNDYTSRTPGCVTEMVNELGWEAYRTDARSPDSASSAKHIMV